MFQLPIEYYTVYIGKSSMEDNVRGINVSKRIFHERWLKSKEGNLQGMPAEEYCVGLLKLEERFNVSKHKRS